MSELHGGFTLLYPDRPVLGHGLLASGRPNMRLELAPPVVVELHL